VKPNLSYHVAVTDDKGSFGLKEVTQVDIRINAGFFVLKKDIFKYIRPGEELVVEPFQRLIRDRQLAFFLPWIPLRTNNG
jgi:glucose-1-phosphate cytidylyltransferase